MLRKNAEIAGLDGVVCSPLESGKFTLFAEMVF